MNQKAAVMTFTVATCLVTLVLTLSNSMMANGLAQIVPGLVAVLLILLTGKFKQSFKNTGLTKIGKARWYAVAFLLPYLVIVFAYTVAAAMGLVEFIQPENLTEWGQLLLRFSVGFIVVMVLGPFIWAFADEFGWRGFRQPKLGQLYGIKQAILVTGFIWAIWHFIFIIWGGYYETGNLAINLLLFFLTVFFMSVALGYLRYESGSLWPAVLFHSSSNMAWQLCSYQFKVLSPNYIYIAGEAGLINLALWALFAWVFWQRLKRVTH